MPVDEPAEVPPVDEAEYQDWLLDWLEEKRAARYRRGIEQQRVLIDHEDLYRNFTGSLVERCERTDFWKLLLHELAERNAEYKLATKHYSLLMVGTSPVAVVQAKSWDSLLQKTYRKNVLHNADYPSPPPGGWITPENWFQGVGDILRTNIIVRYLDGVQVVVKQIESTATAVGLPPPKVTQEAHDDGYYAVHVDVELPIKVPDRVYSLQTETFRLEVQVSTQVQQVIHSLTHTFYDDAKRKVLDPGNVWQWDYSCRQFIPNYLGHVLHYVEGMIMHIRERQEA